MREMPPVHLLIKPASLSCNMRCSYCFSLDIAGNRSKASYGIMSLEILECVVKKALSIAGRQCTFAFQGGEPTLTGLDFYRQLIKYVDQYNKKNAHISYAIQTNGYNIDRDWAAFFAENNFLVGLSLDGAKSLHDMYRTDADGKGTFTKVMRTSQLFNQYNVEYNILTVITAQAAKNIGQIYGFFSRNNFAYRQFIPCLDPLKENRGSCLYSLTPDLYGNFLCALFDLWYSDYIRGKYISVRYFDNLIQIMRGNPPENCAMVGHCTKQIVIDADGSVYPCDFFVLDEYKLGNIYDDDFNKLEETRDVLGFIRDSLQKPAQCEKCRWYPLCRGGCRRDRDMIDETGSIQNYYCSSYNRFFEYAYPRMQEVAFTQ